LLNLLKRFYRFLKGERTGVSGILGNYEDQQSESDLGTTSTTSFRSRPDLQNFGSEDVYIPVNRVSDYHRGIWDKLPRQQLKGYHAVYLTNNNIAYQRQEEEERR